MNPDAPQGDLPALAALGAQVVRMREAGEIDDVGEGVLRRHFDQRAKTLSIELTDLIAEYERRSHEVGEDAARQWLADSAEALGRRDRADTERLIGTVVSTG